MLGFGVDWRHLDIMASVSRDGARIMLCEGDQGNPRTWVWIGVGERPSNTALIGGAIVIGSLLLNEVFALRRKAVIA